MKPVYRIGVHGRVIQVECWASWAAFDSAKPEPITTAADFAHSIGTPPKFDERNAQGFEIQRVRVNNGCSAAAKALIASDILLWQSTGAELIGSFEVVHGHDLPALLLILNWRNVAEAASAQNIIESDAGFKERRLTDRAASGRVAIRGTSRLFGCSLVLTKREEEKA